MFRESFLPAKVNRKNDFEKNNAKKSVPLDVCRRVVFRATTALVVLFLAAWLVANRKPYGREAENGRPQANLTIHENDTATDVKIVNNVN